MSPLPQELTDLILDHLSLLSDEAERSKALFSAALVSSTFRYRAQKHIFSEVAFHFNTHAADQFAKEIRRLHGLQNLLGIQDSAPSPSPTSHSKGLNPTYIRSFVITVAGPMRLGSPTPFEDAALPVIFHQIFREGSEPCSLTIHVSIMMSGIKDWFAWENFTDSFRTAFEALLREPLLATLDLKGLRHMPADLFSGSHVRHLALLGCTVADAPSKSSTEDIVGVASGLGLGSEIVQRTYLNLESFTIDPSLPVVRLLAPHHAPDRPVRSVPALQNLHTLEVRIAQEPTVAQTESLLAFTPTLRCLKVRLVVAQFGAPDRTRPPLCYHHLEHLQLLHIMHFWYYHRNSSTFLDILDILSHPSSPPRSLRTMCITLTIHCQFPNDLLVTPSVHQPASYHARAFEYYDFGPLDRLLADSRFEGVGKVEIRIAVAGSSGGGGGGVGRRPRPMPHAPGEKQWEMVRNGEVLSDAQEEAEGLREAMVSFRRKRYVEEGVDYVKRERLPALCALENEGKKEVEVVPFFVTST